MYLLHIIYSGYEDCEEVIPFYTYSDVLGYVSKLDSDLFEGNCGICVLDCYECKSCVDLLKLRKEKK